MRRGPRLRYVSEALTSLRQRVAPPPIVWERTDLPRGQGTVTTTVVHDYRSPSGKRYRIVAAWPDGRVAERRWAEYEADARAGHDGAIVRQKQRFPPELE